MHALPVDRFSDWAHRLRADDAAALAEVFHVVYPGLLRYATAIAPDAALAEDAVQDAFVTIWTRRHTLDPMRSLRALFYASVRHRLLNQVRDVARRQDLLSQMSPDERTPEPDQHAEAEMLAERLRQWIDELPSRRREAFVLSRFEGLSHAEIAHVMGLSAKTVEHHVGHALRHLRDRLRIYAPDALSR